MLSTYSKVAGFFALLIVAQQAVAQDETFTDPDQAGPDYAIQGEYEGVLDKEGEQFQFGLQVIALGDGAFDAVGYYGGLPGAGWKRGDQVVRGSGKTENGVAKIVSDTGFGLIHDGMVELHSNEHGQVGILKKVVRKSPTLEAKPPEGAKVLFDGHSAEQFERGMIVMENLLAADCETKEKLGDHTLHIEFRTPFKPAARGQARGNSGVYLQGRYECQVLDSFGLEGLNNECGGIYSIAEPLVNACFPPLTWQTYDIEFTAAKWENGQKVQNARTTIKHNGILIHDDLELTHGTPGKDPEGPEPASLYLQGHGNPVVYRNIWLLTK